jgi:hypothetical protein
VLSNGIGEGGIIIANRVCVVGEVVVCAVFPFPYPNLFNRGVTSSAVRVPDESRFKESDEVGLCAGGLNDEGSKSSCTIACHEAPAGGPERGALAGTSAPTSTSTRWALVAM